MHSLLSFEQWLKLELRCLELLVAKKNTLLANPNYLHWRLCTLLNLLTRLTLLNFSWLFRRGNFLAAMLVTRTNTAERVQPMRYTVKDS